MKKICLLLVILLISSLALNCGGADDDTDTTTLATGSTAAASETTKYANDDLGKYDFNNEKFRIHTRTTEHVFDKVEMNGEVLNDAVYNRNRALEERFNFTFEVTVISDYNAHRALVRNTLISGDNSIDVFDTRCPDVYPYASEGLLLPMSKLENINPEKPYWHKSLFDDINIAGTLYFMTGDMTSSVYTSASCIAFNKTIAADLGIPNLYKLVNDGEWTLDKFAEFCLAARKDLDGNGVYDNNDRHGFLGVARLMPLNFITGFGIESIKKDEDGVPYLAVYEQKFVDAFTKVIDVVRIGNAWYGRQPDANINVDPELPKMFKSGNALFLSSGTGSLGGLRDMEIDFGVIPFPKIDKNQEMYYSELGWLEMFCIPKSSTDKMVERTGVILEAMACESAKTYVPAYYDIMLKTKLTRDEESEKMIDLLYSNRMFDMGDSLYSHIVRDGTLTALFMNSSKDLVSSMQKLEGQFKSEVEKTIKTMLAE